MDIRICYMSLTDIDSVCELDSTMEEDALEDSVLRAMLSCPSMSLIRLIALDDYGELLGYAIGSFEEDYTQLIRIVVPPSEDTESVACWLIHGIKELSGGITCRVVAHAAKTDDALIDVLKQSHFHIVEMTDADTYQLESPVDKGGEVIDSIMFGDSRTVIDF